MSSGIVAFKVPDGLGDCPTVDLGGEDDFVADVGLEAVEAKTVLPGRVQRCLLRLVGVDGVQKLELLAPHPGGVCIVDH